MIRKPGTTTTGSSFSLLTIQAVWNKGRQIAGYPFEVWRYDACGKAIKRGDYGNRNSDNGWEIDHIRPVALSGSDALDNLQPLQWAVNVHKGDSYPNWSCPI